MTLVATLTQSLRSSYAPKTLDKNERRGSRYGAWNFYQEQTRLRNSVITPEVNSLIKRSQGNTVQIPVFDAETVTIGNTRSCTVVDSENTSKLVTLTFATYSFAFTMTPAQHGNNDINYQQDFDRKLEKYLQQFASVLDTASVNNLSVNKNQLFDAALTSYYPALAGALQVTQAEKNDFYNNLEAIQETMDFYGKVNIISSTSGKPLVNRLDAQGAQNGVNEAFQLGGYDWNFTNRLLNGAGVQSTLYAVTDGQVAVENRNDWDAVNGSRVGNHKIWDEVQMPIVNLKMGSYYYEDCADRSALTSGTTALTRTKLEGFEFSTDIVFVNAYNSAPVTRYSPILKAEISAT